MGVFSFLSKKSGPYKNEGLNKIYELLFCDNLSLYKTENKSPDAYPWPDLFAEPADIAALQAITADKTLESRQRALAYHLLLKRGIKTNKELLGVIIEVALPGGLDVLAAYGDGSARYINHSGKLVVWETRTDSSAALIQQLLADSINVVKRIGPWDKERRPYPVDGVARLSFLVGDGLYFGEGPFDLLQKDAISAPVINSATALMIFLTQQGQ